MSRYYVACDLGMDEIRLLQGTLHKGELTISPLHSFANVPVKGKDALEWNIPQIYQELVETLRPLGEHDEPINGISCHSWGSDYVLFKSDGTLVSLPRHRNDPRTAVGTKKVLSKLPRETIYDETGTLPFTGSTLFQLGAEKSLRFSGTRFLMPIADGFNYLLSGVPRVEASQASMTQLYNPATKAWSESLLKFVGVSPKLFPPVVTAGTELGPLAPEIAQQSTLRETKVLATCSYERAASLAGLPSNDGENWAYVWPGQETLIGAQLPKPFINETTREMKFSNEVSFGESVCFYKRATGLWILDECRRFWAQKDREMDDELLTHLAASAPPFEALINPADPRFHTPGDLPLKIQAYCKETNQEVPWKPGPIIRCVLESLALLYRKVLTELEYLTGRGSTRLCFLGLPQNILLKSFIANALQLPTLIAPPEAAAIGNIAVQAVALGHINTLDEAREIVRHSIKMETLMPHATIWDTAYQRFVELAVASVPAA